MRKQEIVLIGGGGHCHSVIDVIEEQASYLIAGIIDTSDIASKILNYNIIGKDEQLPELTQKYTFFHVSLGFIKNPDRRNQIFQELIQLRASLPTIISPLAYVSKHAQVGPGTIVMHNAQINAKAVVGNNCIINSKALVEHDVIVGDNCHVSTGAIVNGNVHVGDNTFVGSGAIIVQGNEIPAGSFIRAGSLYHVEKDKAIN